MDAQRMERTMTETKNTHGFDLAAITVACGLSLFGPAQVDNSLPYVLMFALTLRKFHGLRMTATAAVLATWAILTVCQ